MCDSDKSKPGNGWRAGWTCRPAACVPAGAWIDLPGRCLLRSRHRVVSRPPHRAHCLDPARPLNITELQMSCTPARMSTRASFLQ